jgi:TetR/AcrR family transcriptional repressor of nem operon
MVRYPAAETAEKHERILSEASRLFRERGLAGVSVGDLMQAADLTHGSFYNHFDSKETLIAECIAHVGADAAKLIDAAEPTVAGKRGFVSQYLSLAARDDPGGACLMPPLGAEIAREPFARSAMTGYVRGFIDRLMSHFPWPTAANARRDVIRMTTSLVGALVLARAVDDDALSEEILQEVIGQFTGASRRDARQRRASD